MSVFEVLAITVIFILIFSFIFFIVFFLRVNKESKKAFEEFKQRTGRK